MYYLSKIVCIRSWIFITFYRWFQPPSWVENFQDGYQTISKMAFTCNIKQNWCFDSFLTNNDTTLRRTYYTPANFLSYWLWQYYFSSMKFLILKYKVSVLYGCHNFSENSKEVISLKPYFRNAAEIMRSGRERSVSGGTEAKKKERENINNFHIFHRS